MSITSQDRKGKWKIEWCRLNEFVSHVYSNLIFLGPKDCAAFLALDTLNPHSTDSIYDAAVPPHYHRISLAIVL